MGCECSEYQEGAVPPCRRRGAHDTLFCDQELNIGTRRLRRATFLQLLFQSLALIEPEEPTQMGMSLSATGG